jgi:hypothetical protein
MATSRLDKAEYLIREDRRPLGIPLPIQLMPTPELTASPFEQLVLSLVLLVERVGILDLRIKRLRMEERLRIALIERELDRLYFERVDSPLDRSGLPPALEPATLEPAPADYDEFDPVVIAAALQTSLPDNAFHNDQTLVGIREADPPAPRRRRPRRRRQRDDHKQVRLHSDLSSYDLNVDEADLLRHL